MPSTDQVLLTGQLLQTLCKGMKVAQSDADRLHVVEAVKDVEPGLLQSLPELELQWLAATLWNRGCSHVKFGRPAQSLPLMQAALRVQSWRPSDASQHQVCTRHALCWRVGNHACWLERCPHTMQP